MRYQLTIYLIILTVMFGGCIANQRSHPVSDTPVRAEEPIGKIPADPLSDVAQQTGVTPEELGRVFTPVGTLLFYRYRGKVECFDGFIMFAPDGTKDSGELTRCVGEDLPIKPLGTAANGEFKTSQRWVLVYGDLNDQRIQRVSLVDKNGTRLPAESIGRVWYLLEVGHDLEADLVRVEGQDVSGAVLVSLPISISSDIGGPTNGS